MNSKERQQAVGGSQFEIHNKHTIWNSSCFRKGPFRPGLLCLANPFSPADGASKDTINTISGETVFVLVSKLRLEMLPVGETPFRGAGSNRHRIKQTPHSHNGSMSGLHTPRRFAPHTCQFWVSWLPASPSGRAAVSCFPVFLIHLASPPQRKSGQIRLNPTFAPPPPFRVPSPFRSRSRPFTSRPHPNPPLRLSAPSAPLR